MDFKISDTNKGKKSLIYDGFIYRIGGVLKCGDISWRCTNRKCKGRLRTDSAMSTMKAINLEHNHEQDEIKVERQQLRSQVKRKATDNNNSLMCVVSNQIKPTVLYQIKSSQLF